jgi:hydroxymethylpyrimidine pyrophosphatase-like HAD family hydrolase
VHKGWALETLCAKLGIRAEEVIAFGDMPNDLPMLAWAGHGVAVANAHPEVLQQADEITLSYMEDGVAAVLERLIATNLRTDSEF